MKELVKLSSLLALAQGSISSAVSPSGNPEIYLA